MSDEIKIDLLCHCTMNPTTLNALHACRQNHPLGIGNNYKWRNAFSLVMQSNDFNGVDTSWLEHKANAENETNK